MPKRPTKGPATTKQDVERFFKRFAQPKKPVVVNEFIEDEIVVAIPIAANRSRSPVAQDISVEHGASRRSSEGSSTLSSRLTSPTKSSTASPQPKLSSTQIASEVDYAPITSSPSASQRTLKAVEIPTPPERMSPPQVPVQTREHGPNASFSSISTLSSVPMSSSSSSKRIVVNGMNAVTNSDSGSADSSSDELADPSTFIVRKRRKLTPPPGGAAHAIEIKDSGRSSRQSNRLSDQGRQPGGRPQLPRSPPRNVYKHSLMKLVRQREKEDQAVARIREAEVVFEEAQRKREAKLKRDEDLSSGLKVATADDSDEGDRMVLAMQRTEALQEDEKFYYFRNGQQATAKEFPAFDDPEGGPTRPWFKLLQNEQSRHQALLSGFVADIASREALPPALYAWIANQLLVETRSDLCEAYTEVVRVAGLPTPDSAAGLSSLDQLTRDPDSPNRDAARGKASPPTGSPTGLRYWLKIVRHFAGSTDAPPSSIASLVAGLAVAQIDEHVKSDAGLLLEVHDTIESVLHSISNDDLFQPTYRSIYQDLCARNYLSHQLRCQIISSLPATSQRSHRLRRYLALHLIASLGSTQHYIADIDSAEWVETIKDVLESSTSFHISESTNYALLDSLIGVLDIAIDAGFSTAHRPSKRSPVKASALRYKSSSTTTPEATLNQQIDTIAHPLRAMSSRIRGSGTSHLGRAQAKSTVDRLVLRLEHSVRTKPKQRKGVFDDATGDQRAFLSGFLKTAAAHQDRDSVSVVPPDTLDDSGIGDSRRTSGDTSAVSGAESS